MDEIEKDEICDECKELLGLGRRSASRHSNLECTEIKPCSSMFGSVNETYYTCRTCGHKWLYESGSYGYGWIS